MDFYSLQMGAPTKGTLKAIRNTGSEHLNGRMEKSTLVNGRMESNTERESWNLKTERRNMENGNRVKR